jgi:hypothetical protein
MMKEDIEIAIMQAEYDINNWKNQILQNRKRLKEHEKGTRILNEGIRELEEKVREKEKERSSLTEQLG